jgi:RNA polymerase sigma factor (sigma-70 family)
MLAVAAQGAWPEAGHDMLRQPPQTRLTLIQALRDGLRWEEFVALYGPLILVWGRRDFGLQECDAENLCQEVLLRVWRALPGYDPARGSFRHWLRACARNAAHNLRRARHHEVVVGDVPALRERLCRREAPPVPPAAGAQPAGVEESLRELQEQGFAPQWLHQAVLRVRGRVQPQTWTAFLLFDFFELSAKEIAPRLGMKPTTVNQAVFRVRRLLRRELTVPESPHHEPRP